MKTIGIRLFVRSALLQVLVNAIKAKHQFKLPRTQARLYNNPGLFTKYHGHEPYRRIDESGIIYFETPESGLRVLHNRVDASLKKKHSLREFLKLHYSSSMLKEYEASIIKHIYWSTNHRIEAKKPLTRYLVDY